MLARGLSALAVLLGVVGLAGCAGGEPDTTDLDRISVMRAEPIYAHVVGDPEVIEGSEQGGVFVANSYAARVDPWAGQNPPVGPTVAQRREAVASLVVGLRGSGWSIISARCVSEPADSETSTTEDANATAGHEWEAFGYRMRDTVPYTVHLVAGFAESNGFTVRVAMSTPFHADAASYFGAQPAGLAEGRTCIETHKPENQAAQGSIWSLAAARG